MELADSNGMRNWIPNLPATGFLVLTFAASPAVTRCQDGGEVAWEVRLPGIGMAHGRSVVAAEGGGIVAAGWTATVDLAEVQGYLVHLDDQGSVVWETTLASNPGTNHDAWSVSRCTEGGYIVAGSTSFFAGAEKSDFYLTRRAEDGQPIWQETYGGPDPDHGRAAQETSDQGFVFVGLTTPVDGARAEAYVVKTDREGRLVWEKRYGREVTLGALAFLVAEVENGNYLIGGERSDWLPSRYLLKVDSQGDVLWENPLGEQPGSVTWIQLGAGGRALIAWTLVTFSEYGSFVGEIDEAGKVLWETEFADTVKGISSYIVSPNGGFVVAGGYGQDDRGRTCALQIAGADHYGQRLWDRSFVPIGPVECDAAVTQMPDGGYAMVGGTHGKLYAIRLFTAPPNPLLFVRGDSNGDGKQDIADPVATIHQLLHQGPASPCPDAQDSNDDGKVDLTDAVVMLMYLFRRGEALSIPSSFCGLDPSEDEIYCRGQERCLSEE